METLTHTLDFNSASVADIAMEYPSSVNILNKYHIDFCCGGKLPFNQACEKAGVIPETVVAEILDESITHSQGSMNFKSWTPTLLANFIIQHHHSYVKQSIPEIKALLEKVVLVHGMEFPTINTIYANFNALSEELLQHMQKEELVLFPAIIKLADGKEPVESIFPIPLDQPMAVMEDEHQHAGDLLKSIRTLTNYYTVPGFACPTFRIAYTRLKEFDADLTQHIHLENNILFEKVKEMI